jgi:hypothetical protein
LCRNHVLLRKHVLLRLGDKSKVKVKVKDGGRTSQTRLGAKAYIYMPPSGSSFNPLAFSV